MRKSKKVRGFVGREAPHKSSNCVSLELKERESDERFFVGAGCARPNEKSPFEVYGASRHKPQTAIIELTLKEVLRGL